MKLVDLIAGDKELQLSWWDGNEGTIIKGKGYIDFIRRCFFKKKDVVEIWALSSTLLTSLGRPCLMKASCMY